MTAIIPPPPLDELRTERLTARRALLRLLTRHPNTVVTKAEVEEEAGRRFSASAVSSAAATLGRDMAIRTGAGRRGGGYVLLAPGPRPPMLFRCCHTCAEHTPLYHCRALDMETESGQWCWGWTGHE